MTSTGDESGLLQFTGEAKARVESLRKSVRLAHQFLGRYPDQLQEVVQHPQLADLGLSTSDYDELLWEGIHFLIYQSKIYGRRVATDSGWRLIDGFVDGVEETVTHLERERASAYFSDLMLANKVLSVFGYQSKQIREYVIALSDRLLLRDVHGRPPAASLKEWYGKAYRLFMNILAVLLRQAKKKLLIRSSKPPVLTFRDYVELTERNVEHKRYLQGKGRMLRLIVGNASSSKGGGGQRAV